MLKNRYGHSNAKDITYFADVNGNSLANGIPNQWNSANNIILNLSEHNYLVKKAYE